MSDQITGGGCFFLSLLTGEAAQLAGLGDDLAHLNPHIRELAAYVSDAVQVFQVELAQNLAAAGTLSKSLAGTVNLGTAKPSIAEAVIEEIGLHLRELLRR